MYIFPGIGLGTILSRSSQVTDSMVEQASLALAGSLDEDETEAELVYPRLDRIRDVSAQIALSVIRASQNAVSSAMSTPRLVADRRLQNVDNSPTLRHVTDNALLSYIKEQMWDPKMFEKSRM